MIMLGNSSNNSKSNFQQAYERTGSNTVNKKDYITMVSSTPNDNRSEHYESANNNDGMYINSRHESQALGVPKNHL